VNKGIEIARGKTKLLFESPGQPDQLVVVQTDQISAGDGARRNEIAGKGRLAAQTTARVFRLLNLCGLPTHYLSGGEDDDNNEMLARRCNMLPLEVVVRGVAAGSFTRRNPGVQRGMLLVPRVIEFFLKDDANHDPMISPEEIVSRGIATPAELGAMSELARLTFDILTHAWRKRDVLLVDLKIEYGRLTAGKDKGQLVIADVIDNDSWRIWPQGREDRMLDKQMYRNLETVDDAALLRVKGAYEEVADLVGTFPVMRPGMAAIIADAPERAETINAVVAALQGIGLPTIRHVASPARTPGFVLQLVQQMEATFARLFFVAIGADDALRAMLDAASSSPVLAWRGDPGAFALQCAKVLALDDTVLYGRTLLMQANARSAVLHADAMLQQLAGGSAPGATLG
jgi:phosphoribosylaminoimidazole-succinocarboxamide synthase